MPSGLLCIIVVEQMHRLTSLSSCWDINLSLCQIVSKLNDSLEIRSIFTLLLVQILHKVHGFLD